ncbi:MAG: sigma-70 family RNA polymerase sigma factor [Eubacteriales bacterium]|nr:sigma-70 family RNA polymerase sigma factor [Eubacteriales bacterium]
MINQTAHKSIIHELYRVYQAEGYIAEDTVFSTLVDAGIPLHEIDRICDQLLSMGVIICNDPEAYYDENGDENYDRSKLDYEQIFEEVISIDESLTPFIEQLRQIKPPQHREWRNLMPQVKGGNKYALQRLIEMYLRTVVKIALFFHKKLALPLADTLQEGCMGLMTAIDKYEIGRQDVFPIYFPWWVRQNIMRETSFTINPTIYIPVHLREKLFSIWDIVHAHDCDLCNADDYCENLIDEIMKELECDEVNAKFYLRYYNEYLSIEVLCEDNPEALSDHGNCMGKYFDDLYGRELTVNIHQVLETLKPKEQEIIKLRFGLFDTSEHTLEQVGKVYGVTRERIRQIEAKAIRKLQHPTRSKKFRPFY